MNNLVYSLPIELTRKIYEYDPTYKNILDQSLRLIEHGMVKCECGGKVVSLSSCYFHRRLGYTQCMRHYMSGLFNPDIEGLIDPDDYERLFNIANNYNGYDVYDGESYISIHSYIYTPPPYYQSIFCENRKYIICNLVGFYIPQKSIKIINTNKRRQGRYMDMGHYQRREV